MLGRFLVWVCSPQRANEITPPTQDANTLLGSHRLHNIFNKFLDATSNPVTIPACSLSTPSSYDLHHHSSSDTQRDTHFGITCVMRHMGCAHAHHKVEGPVLWHLWVSICASHLHSTGILQYTVYNIRYIIYRIFEVQPRTLSLTLFLCHCICSVHAPLNVRWRRLRQQMCRHIVIWFCTLESSMTHTLIFYVSPYVQPTQCRHTSAVCVSLYGNYT